MKNLYRKILPLFGASCCFLPNKEETFIENLKKFNLTTLTAKVEDIAEQKTRESEKNLSLQNYLNELNKTEIYLLVTDFTHQKTDKPILLLLHTEDRLNSEQALINYRHLKFLFSSSNGRYIKNRNFSIYEIMRPNWFSSLAKTFRSGKAYYPKNLGGYKSICPVFFDKNSAEDFLIQTSKDALILLRDLPLDSNKEVLKGLLNTKIITLGLGDFVEYYSTEKTVSFLENVEFLFVPCIQNQKPTTKEIEKKISILVNKNSFKQYQRQYYSLKIKDKTIN